MPYLTALTFLKPRLRAGDGTGAMSPETISRQTTVPAKRIGDALASKLDLDALVSIRTRSLVEALDAEAGRGRIAGAGTAHPSFPCEDSHELRPLLDRVEEEILEGEAFAETHDETGWALAAPISPAGTVAVVSLARHRAPFTDADRELVSYLCLQAAVAAGDIARHEVLNRQALTDELTGVANHRSFHELLEDAFKHRRKTGEGMSLLLLDLDDFKVINDTFGHQTGDRVLSAVGQCLQRHCRADDEPARHGGEELAIVLPDTDLDHAAHLAERLRREVETLRLEGPFAEPIAVTASFGVASAGSATSGTAALIAAADSALYEAKMSGKNRVCTATASSPPAAERAARRPAHDLPSQLRRGLARDELVLHYQPKIALDSRAPVGVEALLRWHHPELGLLGPARFLRWAEGTDLMPQLTEWVLNGALAQTVAWDEAMHHLPVAVNVAAQDLVDPAFPLAATRALHETGARAEDLTFEITEPAAMAAHQGVGKVLANLREAGITVSVDDFGGGHSSFTRLRDFEADEVKLDRDLLRRSGGATDQAVLHAAISLGHDLGLTVVAEGVEDAESLELLAGMECDVAQGYHICPPLLPDELDQWLKTQPLVEVAPTEPSPVSPPEARIAGL